MVDKSSFFVYPSRRLGIDARRLAIPSLRSLHHRAKCGVYHQGRIAPLYLITRQRAYSLRLDDILPCGLMIYRNKLRVIYKVYALIYLQKCDIINSTINKNLADGKNNGIVELVKKQV